MRDAANRTFGYALLAAVALHALLLYALPSLRDLAAQLPPAANPLVARLAPTAPTPASSASAGEVRKPPVPQAQPARAASEPLPLPQPATAVAPQVHSVAIETAPAAPAAPLTSPAPGPVARIEPQPATASAGPDPAALGRYRLQIVTVAARFKRYPRAAIDNDWQGEVVVRMTIGADGSLAALGIKSSSGHAILDQQALEMFKSARPFVLLPPELAGREFELELRAIYSLKDQPPG